MQSVLNVILALLLIGQTVGVLRAQSSVPSPSATGPSTVAGGVPVFLTEVVGAVEYRTPPGAAWRVAQVSMQFTEGVEFRTGLRSHVDFKIGDVQSVRLERLSSAIVARANVEDGKLRSLLAMPRGGVIDATVRGGAGEQELEIRAPSSTLAVRGTRVRLYDQVPFVPEAVSLTGRAFFRDARRQLTFGSTSKTTVRADGRAPAELARSESYVDPAVAASRTPAEQQLVEQLLAQGAIVELGAAGIPVVRGGIPTTLAQVAANPPGRLTFTLNWTGNSDLNLSIFIPSRNEFIAPVAGATASASGGRTAFDHQGGPNGGVEIIFWPGSFPGSLAGPRDDVLYVPVVDFISGSRTNFEFQSVVFEDGASKDVNPKQIGSIGPRPPSGSPRAPASRRRK